MADIPEELSAMLEIAKHEARAAYVRGLLDGMDVTKDAIDRMLKNPMMRRQPEYLGLSLASDAISDFSTEVRTKIGQQTEGGG